jgi:6,7-dimethyl-8-ribityllumazine synthase
MSRDTPTLDPVDAAGLTIAVAAACFNRRLVDALLAQVTDELRRAGIRDRRTTVVRVPGSHELPTAVQWLCARRPDACIALGVIIRGQTLHYDLVARAASDGLLRVALEARIPVINGVIVAENRRQAAARCTGRLGKGGEFAQAALTMAALKRKLAG